ncbi:DUF6132 family protein [Flavobacterium sp.]|jgi:hypothetical protein|uniref:DUF6132 family protein n=1 Tax=Flavobacterium sp. TaxID=239 RepID=UPI0037BF3751
MSKKAVLITTLGILIGAVGGYAYFYFIGCAGGTCAITSKPLNSTLYGGLMGGLLFNILVPKPKQEK